MKRIFIALKVEAGESLQKFISSLKILFENDKINWTNLHNIHITLAFPGNTEEEIITLISEMLSEQCKGFGNFELTIKGSGVFKSLTDPRVFWTGIESSEKLIHLNRIIINGLKLAGVALENRPFNPHLTLGRIKVIKDKALLKSTLESYQNTEFQMVPVNEVILYESILIQSGPVYKPLNKFSLMPFPVH